jgi:23S rRNA U2552 (ribose-2'-O)-methylase RlmE/FtsJ
MKCYEEVFKCHNGFTSHKWVHYFYIYDLLFQKYLERNEPLTFMEIGVARGGSLEIWKKYLPENSKIHGVDINPKCNDIKFSENINFYFGSASDHNFMEKTFGDIEFDIILDDGSHICDDVIETFKIMFPRIKDGGLYIVEDLHTSYWEKWGGGFRKKGTSIEYFKDLVEAINSDYVSSIDNYVSNYSKNIESITFYDSICTIKKYTSPKTCQFISVVSGEENMGKVNCFKNELGIIFSVKNTFLGTEKYADLKLCDELSFLQNMADTPPVYDIESFELADGGIVLQCGSIDPQLYLTLPHSLRKPTGIPLCEVTYTNSVAGNLQFFWDFGGGLSEENSTRCYIDFSTKTESLLLPIINWKDDVKLTAFRVDPPDVTRFVLKSVKFLEASK